MTNKEKIIVSAYTGTLMCDFSDLHEYIEEKMGRPVWTHEFPSLQKLIKELSKDDFLKICNDENNE